jgi:mono-ADP-ribosyltransferase sirtuin 6
MSLTSIDPNTTTTISASSRRQTRSATATPAAQLGQIAAILRQSKNVVVFTGAGISSDSGIPTYRDAQSQQQLAVFTNAQLAQAKPNAGHYALQQLVARGVVSCVITTNVDGLHFKSGIPEEHLIELHGSLFTARCPNPQCGRVTRFPAPVCNETAKTLTAGTTQASSLLTNYACPHCRNGPLVCTAVAMGADIHASDYERSVTTLSMADLCITIGTSLKVGPVALLPFCAKSVAICALEPTAYDQNVKCVCKVTVPATRLLEALANDTKSQ